MAVGDIVALVRRYLEEEPWTDSLAANVAQAATSMTVTSSGAWEEADVAEEQGAGEQFYVTADAPASTVSIRKGHNGTTDAAVTSGTVLAKNPRYPFTNIEKNVDLVLDEIYPDVFEVRSSTVTPDTNTLVYDVPSDYIGFIDLVQPSTGTPARPVHVDPRREHWNLPTGTWAQGVGLEIPSFARDDTDATLTYIAKVTTGTTDTQLRRIVAMGAAAKLLRQEAAQKADREDEFERGRSMIFAARDLGQDYQAAIGAFRAEVVSRYGPVKRFRPRRQLSVY